mmetsp:Transcript_96770/g.273657  ORF Transcript_96770/g.273657 Transcript_96770/m.273657 type:complete len:421 (+) Transcript_96770:210-1472(+)
MHLQRRSRLPAKLPARPPARDRPGPEPELRLLDRVVPGLEHAELGLLGVVLERPAPHDGAPARRRALLDGARPQGLHPPVRRVVCQAAELLEALGAARERALLARLFGTARPAGDVVPEQLGEPARRGVHVGVHGAEQLLVELPGALPDPLPGQREAGTLRVVEPLLLGGAQCLYVRPEGVVPGVVVAVVREPQHALLPLQPQARLVQALRRPLIKAQGHKVVGREGHADQIIRRSTRKFVTLVVLLHVVLRLPLSVEHKPRPTAVAAIARERPPAQDVVVERGPWVDVAVPMVSFLRHAGRGRLRLGEDGPVCEHVVVLDDVVQEGVGLTALVRKLLAVSRAPWVIFGGTLAVGRDQTVVHGAPPNVLIVVREHDLHLVLTNRPVLDRPQRLPLRAGQHLDLFLQHDRRFPDEIFLGHR